MTTITQAQLDSYLSSGWRVRETRNETDTSKEVDIAKERMTYAGIAKRVASVPLGCVTVPLGLALTPVVFILSGIVNYPQAISEGQCCSTRCIAGGRRNYLAKPADHATYTLAAGMIAPVALWQGDDRELDTRTFRVLKQPTQKKDS